jgi:hypothetical protein
VKQSSSSSSLIEVMIVSLMEVLCFDGERGNMMATVYRSSESAAEA